MEPNKIFGLGVFVCVFNKDFSKIMLIKRNEEKRKKWNADWGNVGGKIEFGETSLQACIREAQEETGLDIDPSELREVYVKETPNFLPQVHAIHFVYAASIDENSEITLNSESDGYEWFKLEELPDRMIDSKEDIIKWWTLAKADKK